MKRAIFVFLAGVALVGCASNPSPVLINGRYYMASDAGCALYSQMSPTRIMCYNRQGVEQGWEDAIPHQTMAIYNQRQAMARQQIRELTDQLNQTADSIARSNQAAAASYNQTLGSMPTTTQPIGPQETQTTCLVNGRYVSCRTRPN